MEIHICLFQVLHTFGCKITVDKMGVTLEGVGCVCVCVGGGGGGGGGGVNHHPG